MKKIFYWAPLLSKIATRKAVINSALSLTKYSKEYDVALINVTGEFTGIDKEYKNLKVLNLNNKLVNKNFSGTGYLKTRISLIYIFIRSFVPLIKLLNKEKPDYIIIHLLTSLPLIIFNLFKFKTRCILRISGYPKLHFLRLILWRLSAKKIYKISCPTSLTANYIKSMKLIENNKISTLYDPVIKYHDKLNLKNNFKYDKKFFLSVGRLTKQKNFPFLINAFSKIRDSKFILLIAGEGEDKRSLQSLINEKKLGEKIFLIGHKENIGQYFKNCEALILSSEFEDPGFAIIEAAFYRTSIISCDCENGPKEILKNGINSFVYSKNNQTSFLEAFREFNSTKKEDIFRRKVQASRMAKKFTIFSHFKKLKEILN